jgi:acyl-CoA reductase-like NAD-dependent aldehyde dehydrogenase
MEASAPTRRLESFSPLDGRRLGTLPATDPAGVQAIVDDVAEVQPFWAELPLEDRARYMGRAGQVILDRLDELSELLSREQGKPRTEAYTMELMPTVDSLRWIAEQGPSILEGEGAPLPAVMWGKRARHELEPLGVVGVISPWWPSRSCAATASC